MISIISQFEMYISQILVLFFIKLITTTVKFLCYKLILCLGLPIIPIYAHSNVCILKFVLLALSVIPKLDFIIKILLLFALVVISQIAKGKIRFSQCCYVLLRFSFVLLEFRLFAKKVSTVTSVIEFLRISKLEIMLA